MNNSDVLFNSCDWLFVGFCGGREEQFRAINLCRRFDGTVLFREGDVIVVEVNADRETIDELLAQLPRGGVTHLWRSGAQITTHAMVFRRDSSSRPLDDKELSSLVPALHP